MHISHAVRRRGRAAVTGAAAVLAAALLQSITPATALPANVFELDANTVDPAGGGDDWNTLFAGGANSSDAFSGIIDDPLGETIFVQGESTKDDVDTTTWQHKSGSVPDKDELTNAYSAAYLVGDGSDPGTEDDLILYFGADRFAVNGSANLGFWFYESDFGPDPIVPPATEGTFHGDPHTVGDVLVLTEFTNGGAVPNIQVWEWDPVNPAPTTCPSNISGSTPVPCQDNDGNLKLVSNSSTADCDVAPAGAAACANVNSAETTVPWPYDAKGGGNQQGKVPAGGFFEGGVNLSQLFGGAQPCISSFLAETRSSPSIDSTLKDFVSGSLPLCGANIKIRGTDVNEVGEQHTFTVEVNRIFAGTEINATDAHVTFNLVGANGATVAIDAAASTCDDAGDNIDANGECTIVFNSATTGTVTGTASATVTFGGQTFTPSTNGSGSNSGPAVKRYVDARINLTPLTDTNGITENHVVTADVDVDLGDGNGFQPALVGHVDVKVTSSGGASHVINTGGTTCHVQDPPDAAGADNLDGLGRCTVAFTSNSAGTVTVQATVNLTAITPQGNEPITRVTNTAGNSDNATKVFLDGTLTWLKVDDLGNPLPGATFEVCRTHNWSSETNAMVDVADVCVTVADDVSAVDDPDVAPDADNDGAEFRLENLILGRYTITETIAPDGYSLDPDTETVDLTTSATSGQPTNGDGSPKPFVDPALFKVIILTCNTSTEKLVVSEVDEDPGTAGGKKDTQAAGSLSDADQAYLCGLDANYDDKTRGTHNYAVTIPKP